MLPMRFHVPTFPLLHIFAQSLHCSVPPCCLCAFTSLLSLCSTYSHSLCTAPSPHAAYALSRPYFPSAPHIRTVFALLRPPMLPMRFHVPTFPLLHIFAQSL